VSRLLTFRFIQAVLILFAMSFAVYGMIGLMPGDPIDLMISADPDLKPADANRLKALYGLDKPITERWGNWLRAALGGDFGYSRTHAVPVGQVLLPALTNTVTLMLASFVISIAISIPVGVYSACKRNSIGDYVVNIVAFAGISIPTFWFALILILVFAVSLGWLPAGGTGELDSDSGWGRLRYLILPAATLIIGSVGGQIRFVRGSMIEALRQDYVRTARAKGASEWRVVFGHALRNACIPVVTILALDFGTLLSGALVAETVFGWPGMGKLIYDAILGSDFNLALVALLLATAVTLFASLAADLIYVRLDPRISYR
jgi:peptide/nickel transport system permease protein